MTPREAEQHHALRITVRFHGAVVDDALRLGAGPLDLDDGQLGLPPLDAGPPLGVVLRTGRASARVDREGADPVELRPDAPYRRAWGDVELELSLTPTWQVVPREHSQDLGFLLALAACVLLAMLLDQLAGQLSRPGPSQPPELAPELIARLLEGETDGADAGVYYEEQERPTHGLSIQDIYLPSGDDGRKDKVGGAREQAEDRQRGQRDDELVARHQPLPPAPPQSPEGASAPDAPVPDVREPQSLDEGEAEPAEDQDAAVAEADEGFGLEDWYGAEDARAEREEIARQLDMARELVRIDPESAWALQQLALYQYLAGDLDDCRATYERYIELYPEDSSGYNNLALVYKRKGQFSKEEGYYRLALAIDPDEEHALSNLGLNLAHQGRFNEALAIMDRLQAIDPRDPYVDLHRAKIHAARGDADEALRLLEQALAGMRALDTLHHIEFRQDIRLDPAFDGLRADSRFHGLLVRYYGGFGDELRGSGGQRG